MPHSWLPGFRVAVVLMEAVHHNPGEQWCVRHTMTAHSPCNVRVWLRRRHNRSEEHTSELQSPCNLVCRLLLEKNRGAPRGAPARALREPTRALARHPGGAREAPGCVTSLRQASGCRARQTGVLFFF